MASCAQEKDRAIADKAGIEVLEALSALRREITGYALTTFTVSKLTVMDLAEDADDVFGVVGAIRVR
jgi:hypothetical protein